MKKALRLVLIGSLVLGLSACAPGVDGVNVLNPSGIEFTIPKSAALVGVQIFGRNMQTYAASCTTTPIGISCLFYAPLPNKMLIRFSGDFYSARALYWTQADLDAVGNRLSEDILRLGRNLEVRFLN